MAWQAPRCEDDTEAAVYLVGRLFGPQPSVSPAPDPPFVQLFRIPLQLYWAIRDGLVEAEP